MYVQHHGWLLGWLRRRLGSHEQAADMAHDTFLRLLLKPDGLQIMEPRAYLTVIAKGLLANGWRRQQLENAFLEALSLLPEPQLPSLEERAIVLETLLEIDAVLSRLPDKVRMTFLLAQLEGLTYAEIAIKIKVSVRTVKRYMVEAYAVCLVSLS